MNIMFSYMQSILSKEGALIEEEEIGEREDKKGWKWCR